MIPRLIPYAARLSQMLRAPLTLEGAAAEITEVAPASVIDLPGVMMFDEDRDRVTGTMPWTTLKAEWRRVAGGPYDAPAIRRFVFKDVLATPQGMFTRAGGLNQYGRLDRREVLASDIPALDAGYYASHALALQYFGHFVTESLASAALAQDHEALYMPLNPAWPHARAYAEAAGIAPLEADYVFFRKMSFCLDLWPSAHRIARVREVHHRLQAKAGKSGAAGLYMSRGGSGSARDLVNEEALIKALEARGFAIASVRDPLKDIWRKGAGAPMTVGVEGSQMAHATLAARPGAFHLQLNPADRFNNNYAERMPAFQGQIANVVIDPTPEGYHVDVDAVLRMLDRGADWQAGR